MDPDDYPEYDPPTPEDVEVWTERDQQDEMFESGFYDFEGAA